jgi:hypothetical protein
MEESLFSLLAGPNTTPFEQAQVAPPSPRRPTNSFAPFKDNDPDDKEDGADDTHGDTPCTPVKDGGSQPLLTNDGNVPSPGATPQPETTDNDVDNTSTIATPVCAAFIAYNCAISAAIGNVTVTFPTLTIPSNPTNTDLWLMLHSLTGKTDSVTNDLFGKYNALSRKLDKVMQDQTSLCGSINLANLLWNSDKLSCLGARVDTMASKIITSIHSKLASELNTLCNLVANNIKSNVNNIKKTVIPEEGQRTLSQAIELQSTIEARLTALKNCSPLPNPTTHFGAPSPPLGINGTDTNGDPAPNIAGVSVAQVINITDNEGNPPETPAIPTKHQTLKSLFSLRGISVQVLVAPLPPSNQRCGALMI